MPPFCLFFSPRDQSKLRKLQACHQMHAGPQLPVRKHVPSSGRGCSWKVGPATVPGLSFLPTRLLPFPVPVRRSLSPTPLPLPFASSCSSSLPFLVHSTCFKKKTILKGGGLLSFFHLRCCHFQS